MRISFIGSGKVATHLARACSGQHQIVQVMSRNLENAEKLAQQVGANAIKAYHELNPDIDLAVIAVSDQSIQAVIQELHPYLPDVLIVHTSGSTDLNILTRVHANAGVFYPLQTFSFERKIDWTETPLFIEATTAKSLEILDSLANSLSSRVYSYSSSQRLSLHLAAVFACNFSNYCYDMAKQVVDQQQVDFSLLYPLILETARKATEYDPAQVQTGPAARKDQNILKMHEHLLETSGRTDLMEVYQLLSRGILERNT